MDRDGRLIAFERIENFRDFGGYALAGGGRLARGRLFRSGHHASATPADLDRLGDLGLATVVDLRRGVERKRQPSRRHPGFAAAVLECGARDDEPAEAPHITFLRHTELTEDSGRGFMLDLYRAMPLSAHHLDLFGRYLRTLAERDGPILIHCAAGKDRTGFLVALTQRILGAHPDDVLQDYLLTNTAVRRDARAPAVARDIAARTGRTPSETAVAAFLGVEPAFLEAAFAAVGARFGDLDAYVARGLGIDRATRDRIAERLSA